MIKTDKAVYRVRTQEEHDWLMYELDEAGCEWENGSPPIDDDEDWNSAMSDSHIWLRDKIISYSFPEFFYDYYKDRQDYEIMEVSDLMKRAIKTDKVIYRVRTQEEYDWLMKELEEDECKWVYGELPTKFNDWGEYSTETCIRLKDKIMDYADFDFYKNESAYQDYEFIEVSDLMENEMKTDILDKLETMNEHLNNKLENLEKENDESQKIKKVVYTTEVYFE